MMHMINIRFVGSVVGWLGEVFTSKQTGASVS